MRVVQAFRAIAIFTFASVRSVALRGDSDGKRPVGRSISLLSDREREVMKESLQAECQTSTDTCLHGADKCYCFCKGSASCLSVCDEIKGMVCGGGSPEMDAISTDNAAEVAAVAAAAASSTIKRQLRQAIGQVKDLAWEASVDAQKTIHKIMQSSASTVKDAAQGSIPASASKSAVKTSAAEAADSAESIAKMAAAAAVRAAGG